MASEDAEVAALDRVLTRTVLTKDEDLQQLLVKLLPALVSKLATTQARVRSKTLELLNHINKRLKGLNDTALPLMPLVQLAVDPSGPPMVRSFALVYVEMGVGRAPPGDQLQAVPLLLSGLSRRSPQHQAVALRVITTALSALQPAAGGSYSQVTVPGCSSPVNAVNLLPPESTDRQLFLSHCLKLLLYQRPSSGGRVQLQTPLGLANAAAAPAAAAAAAATAAAADALRAQPGLSGADVAALEEKGVPEQEQLIKQKLGVLSVLAAAAAGMPGNAVAAAAAAAAAAAGSNDGSNAAAAAAAAAASGDEGMDVDQPAAAAAAGANGDSSSSSSSSSTAQFLTSEELLLPLLAASCDPYEAVSRRGGDLLVKLVNPDAAKPAVDLEQRALVEALIRLLLGDQDPTATPPAGPALAVRIMQLLVRSVTAASIFPGAPLVMHACLTGPASSPRLVRLGAEWTGWVFKHAPAHQLKAMAGPVTQRLLSALGLNDEADDTPVTAAGDASTAAAGSNGGSSSGGALAALAGNAEARGHVFSAVAQLANRMPDLFKDNTHLASRLFGALSVEAPGSRTSLQEALAALAAALAGGIKGDTAAAAGGAAGGDVSEGDAAKLQEIEELLMSSIGSEQAAVRLCAAQWAARLFPRSHMASRYVLLLAAGDTKPEVRDVGLNGLGLHPSQIAPGLAPSAYAAAVAGLGLPLPGDVISHLVGRHKQLGLNGDLSRPLPLPDASCQALIAFIHAAATAAAAAGSTLQQQQYDAAAHALLLENLACRGAGRETVAAALEGLVGLVGGTAAWMRGEDGARAAAALQERYSTRQPWLLHWLSHNHLPVRTAAAQLLALSGCASSSDAAAAAAEGLMQQLLGNFPPLTAGSSSSSKLLEEQEGSMLAAGLLLARARTSQHPLVAQQQSVITALHEQLTHHAGSSSSSSSNEAPVGSSNSGSGRSPVLAGAAAQALGYLGLVGVPLPGLETSAAAAATAAAAAAAANTAASGSKGSCEEPPLLRLLFGLAGSKDSRTVLRAVTAVGYTGAGSSSQELKMAAAKGLLRVVSAKGVSEEVLLAAGEALAAIAGDIDFFEPGDLLWSPYDSIADCVDARRPPAAGSTAPEAMQVDVQPQQQQKEEGEPGACGGVQQYLLQELCGVLCVAPKEEVRCAGVVVLVSLLQLCTSSPLLREQLPRLQATFTGLLGDSNDLTQDLAARGVSLVYSRGGSGLQQQLLGQLLGLLQGSTATAGGPGTTAAGAAGVKLTGDTKIFEEGQLGNTPGGAGLTTYRELCSLANEMGQPDLIYRFMDLARASSNLSAKRGAAVGVARIARLAATAAGQDQPGGGGLASLLGPDRMAALLPKLYRLTHDPSPKVADSMSAIWAALLDDPRAVLDKHFDPIAKSLLSDMGARLWRVRQAAAAGLTELLSGRRWGQLAPHMEQMWVMALRAFDDVKESVRASAAGLLRSLRGISLRLMDRSQTPATDVAACCQVVLPLLAGSQGLGSGVEEVRAISTDVLCSGIKTAGPAQVLPVLPLVVPVLLEALSGLEDARLNYVEQHAERVGIDAEKLAAARLAAARASSLTEALDACCRSLTGAAATDMSPGLAALVRRGVGLNTKAGTARFIKGLATRLGPDLRPAAPALLKPLLSAVANESSGQVKKAYAAAAAALAVRCVGDKRQEKFVTDAVAAYGAVPVVLQAVRIEPGQQQQQPQGVPMSGVESSGGGDDSSRQAGGLLLRELLRESGDTFGKYASQILHVAFLASHDESSSVSGAWSSVWTEGCPSEPAALRLHTPELAGLISGALSSSSWGRKRAAAKALVVLSGVAPDQLSPYSPHLAQQLLQEGAEGRLWEGKEGLLTALGALSAACTAALCMVPGLTVLLQGLLAAAARKKTTFRTAALAALQQLLDALPPLTKAPPAATGKEAVVDGGAVWEVVSPPMLLALQQQLAAASKIPATATAAAPGAGEGVEDEVKPLPLLEVCNCLASAWNVLPADKQPSAAPQLVTPLVGLLTAAGLSWSTWLSLVTLAAALTAAAAAGGGGSSGSNGGSGGYVVALVPLAGGLVHVLQHSTISQLRLKCLETLLQLLTLIQADAAATAAFKSAAAAPTAAQQQQTDSSVSSSSSALAGLVSGCLSGVSASDPSAAHKALAAQAAAVLQKIA